MSDEKQPYSLFENTTAMGRSAPLPPETTATNFYHLNLNMCAPTPSATHVVPLNASAVWQPSMMTIAQYNELLGLYMKRGDVIRSAIHSLRARQDVAGTLPPCDEMLLAELEACE